MTQQTGTQLKPLLNLQIDQADFTQLEKTFAEYLDQIKASVPAADEAAGASDRLGKARDEEKDKTDKSKRTNEEHELSLKKSKREALEAYGATMFLVQGILHLASSSDRENKELEKVNRAMSEGVGQGFELAGMLGMLGIASGGTAVLIGALATVAVTLMRVLSDVENVTDRNKRIQEEFAASMRGASAAAWDLYITQLKIAAEEAKKHLQQEQSRHKVWSEDIPLLGMIAKGIHNLIYDTKDLKEAEQQNTIAQETYQTALKERASLTKSTFEIEKFVQQSMLDLIVNTNDRARKEAELTYRDEIDMINASEARGKAKTDALNIAWEKYQTKLRQINTEERNAAITSGKQITDSFLKAADDRFESELNLRRASLIQQGVETETIDLRMIQLRRARYEAQLKELSKVVGPLSTEALQKQIELEKQITQLEVQEADKRKGIKQNEINFTTQMADLQMQEVLSRVRLRGIEQGKSEDQIQQDLFERKKQALESELGLINEGEAQGLTLDHKTLLHKQQIETELSALATEGAEMRKRIAEDERQTILNGMQSMISNIDSMFGSLFQLQQQSTTRELNDEKKKKQAMLDAEKEKRLAAATTAEQRSAIEKEYAAEKDELDKQMNDKAREQMKTMFGLQKAAQIANAMINTYSAAAAALAPPPLGLGPVFGPIVAATAIAAGLANVAVIAAQEVPGLAEGDIVRRPTFALIGEKEPEIVTPERNFLTAFKQDLAPRLIDILVPQIKASVLAAINVPGQGTVVVNVNIDKYYGDEDHFEKVLKPTIEDAMRRAGTDNAASLFVNSKRT